MRGDAKFYLKGSQALGHTSVSYTHLDVYKRQEEHLKILVHKK